MLNKIFVVDMVNGFALNGNLYSKNIQNIIEPIANFLEKNNGSSITFLCDSHEQDDIEMNEYPLHCLKDTTESEVVNKLTKYAKNIVYKNCTNSFFFINKEELHNFEKIELVGCCTDICVLQLALTLKTYFNSLKINKDIIVYSDLVATFDNENHNAEEFNDFALKLMKNAGIKVKKWSK
ncbi:isochorismatase family cysteine hydrolase [Mycoplasma anserisalpingitidis]|uniref:isochorismatase family cysteine hydrolase n=1 Tax=Mycoplasma anserisalpingitidis TaxID=519450 RepID=UPI001911BC4A|nr:isochorismatase family cysteine hydrolase [Mycoplasma anserisalpingitidis]